MIGPPTPWRPLSLLLTAAIAGTASATEPVRYDYERPMLGTIVRLAVYSDDEALANDVARAAYARAKALNAILSDYEPESELNRLARRGRPGVRIPVSRELHEVLTHARCVSRASRGAFDPTVGPLTKLWRTARNQKSLPGETALREARSRVDWRAVQLHAEPRSVELRKSGMRLDLGGIAKGYIADAMLAEAASRGLSVAMIDAGGDLVLGDPPPRRKGWRIAVADFKEGKGLPGLIEVANCGVATSGDLYQSVTIGGVRYSHIVDPRTGLGLTKRSRVTVVAPSGMAADAMASAISVLGPVEGRRLAEQTRHVSAHVQWPDGEVVRTMTTKGFPPYLRPPAPRHEKRAEPPSEQPIEKRAE